MIFPLCILELTDTNDREMMTSIYQEYSRYIFSVAYYILRNQQDAEDVLQECWIGWCKPHDILTIRNKSQQPGCELRNYIAKCVRNKCFTFLASKRKRKEHLFDDYAQLLDTLETGSVPSVERVAGINIELEECLHIIMEMPPSLRQIMMMYHIESMSFTEISKVTGKPENAIRSALSKAQAKLRKEMVEGGE